MKKLQTWRAAALALAAAALLAGCGGGDGGTAGAGAFVSTGDLVNQYASSLGQPVSALAIVPAAFASSYLDAGMTRAQVQDALQQDVAAAGANAGFSGIPGATLADVAITNCNAGGVCTLTGTLTNADADTTSVPFSTQVVLENGKYRLLGDQQAS